MANSKENSNSYFNANKFFETIPDNCKNTFQSIIQAMMDKQKELLKVSVKDYAEFEKEL